MTAIGSSYPVTVNGYSCRNCSDVSRAEKSIDPADPLGTAAAVKKSDTGHFNRAAAYDPQAAALNAFAMQQAEAPMPIRAYAAAAIPTGGIVSLSA